jgi:hypothetical protein
VRPLGEFSVSVGSWDFRCAAACGATSLPALGRKDPAKIGSSGVLDTALQPGTGDSAEDILFGTCRGLLGITFGGAVALWRRGSDPDSPLWAPAKTDLGRRCHARAESRYTSMTAIRAPRCQQQAANGPNVAEPGSPGQLLASAPSCGPDKGLFRLRHPGGSARPTAAQRPARPSTATTIGVACDSLS